MAVSGAYTVTGNTITLTAATSAPSPVQCSSVTLGGNQYRVINASTKSFVGNGPEPTRVV